MELAVTLEKRALSGAASLARFKKTNSDKLKTLRILDVDWPGATGTYFQLVTFLSEAIKLDGEPLVFRCLASGLGGYERALGRPDDVRLTAFLEALLTPAVEVLAAHEICAAQDVWSPEIGEPLLRWLETHSVAAAAPTVQRRACPADAATLRSALNQFVLGGVVWNKADAADLAR